MKQRRGRKQRTRLRQGEQLEARYVLDSTVVFNELMYHPLDAAGDIEFVELYNQMAVDMDISNWKLSDGVEFEFPKGTIVEGGGYLVIAKDPARLLEVAGVSALGPYDGRLSNSGERLELSDRNDRIMDVLDYDDQAPWPEAADGLGVSLAKRRLNDGSDRVANWTSSIVLGGTPGRSNFGEVAGPPPEPTVTQVLTAGDTWRTYDDVTPPAAAWVTSDFDDASWPETAGVHYAGDARIAGTQGEQVQGVEATASSFLAGQEPSQLVDGSGMVGDAHVNSDPTDTMWSSSGNFFGISPDLDPEVTFDLGSVRRLDSVRVYNYNDVDTPTCCLQRGLAVADILVAGEDGQFTLWRDDQTFEIAPGTQTDFSQRIDFGGTEARYIRFDVDTTNGVANHGDAFSFVGLSEVQFFTPPVPGNTELSIGANSLYFRKEFVFEENAARSDLFADFLLDDGAVVYLNGQEIYRHNMPTGPVTPATRAAVEIGDADWVRNVELPSSALKSGRNVLAVSLHQASDNDSDALFGMELTAITSPPQPNEIDVAPIHIERLSSGDDDRLEIVLSNHGDEQVDVSGLQVLSTRGFQYTIPSGQTLAPGATLAVPSTLMPHEVDDDLLLLNADASNLIDSARLAANPRLRQTLDPPTWLNPLSPVHDEIVINEIMYNHRPITADAEGNPLEYADVPEEWIELYNRSDDAVDLSGWTLEDAITYAFPAGTVVPAGGYLVVANDAESLRQKYPELGSVIVGDFERSLNNQTDHIILRDDASNVADEVEYFENGQWPAAADGRGSSLELRDPNADNSVGLAWAASDESLASPWRTYTYRGVAERSRVGPDGAWNELVLGLLSDGEVLLDDVSVIQDPSGQAIELIQNGTFEGDTLETHADTWRLIGNHRHSEVIVDPDDPSNQVLRFVATSATEHMHNHAETTLKNGDSYVTIRNGTEYQISYRAKWISGSNLLNSRLYFNRLPKTTTIAQPMFHGTPGRVNSMATENLGPTYRAFKHEPSVPAAGQATRVSVQASDADGVASLTLWYSIEGGAWQSEPMTLGQDNEYAAYVPGQSAGTIVQFYVEGSDGAGATSVFPRDGANSRALFQVDDGKAETNGLHNMRMIVTPQDADLLHDTVELMSNDRIGATFIYNESEVFYDAGIRLSGSQRARPYQPRLSFNIAFNSDQLFRGVHASIALDRSESTGFGQRELIYHHGMSHAGGLPSEYNDLFYIITPRAVHTGTAEAQLARYSDIFLDSQYENGADGQLYEYELIYYPTSTDTGTPEGRKRPQPDNVVGTPIRSLGDNPDDYRWNYLNKNNRQQNDYARFMEFADAMGQSTSRFNEIIGDYIDVDQWLRAFAFSVITGHGDNYGGDGAQHNLQLYVRPSDNRVLFFPHDLDAFFDPNRAIIGNSDLRKLIRVPENEHMYYGHVYDMIQTTFNEEYMSYWTDHFGELLPRQPFDRHLSDLVRRSDKLLSDIRRAVPEVEFATTQEVYQTDQPTVTIAGTAWVDVRQVRLAGNADPLPIVWTDASDWSVELPVVGGAQDVTLEAYDFEGEFVGAVTVQVIGSRGDLTGDGLVDVADIDFLCAAIRAEDHSVDLNGDQIADLQDLNVLVKDLLQSEFGDANVDGRFNSSDLVAIFQLGFYEQISPSPVGWGAGDWNCDGQFSTQDLVVAFQNGGYTTNALNAKEIESLGVTDDGSAGKPTSENQQMIELTDLAFSRLAVFDKMATDVPRDVDREASDGVRQLRLADVGPTGNVVRPLQDLATSRKRQWGVVDTLFDSEDGRFERSLRLAEQVEIEQIARLRLDDGIKDDRAKND